MKNTLRLLLALLLSCTTLIVTGYPSWGIKIDKIGNIYFPDILHNGMGTLWKLSPEGQLNPVVKNFHAHNVSLDMDGNPVSAHSEGSQSMIRFLQNGSRDTLFHTRDFRKFYGGNSTFSPDGSILFQNDQHVWKINEFGETVKFNEHTLEWSQTIFASKDGSVYVPEIGYGKGKIYKLEENGDARLVADNLITKSEERDYDKYADILLGMNEDESGNLYVCEIAGKKVIQIDKKGQKKDFFVSKDGWTPCGITFHENHAYVLSMHTEKGLIGPRIYKVDAKGQSNVHFDYDEYIKRGSIGAVVEEYGGKTSFFKSYGLYIFLSVLASLFLIIRSQNISQREQEIRKMLNN